MATSDEISINHTQFDPTDHPTDVYDAFNECIASFQYKYQSYTKDPPLGVTGAAITAWHQQNKRKYFLGKFASRNLQKDLEDLTTQAVRDTLGFDEMVALLKARYLPTKNSTIRNFQFHSLKQEDGEAFDTFVNRVKHEAAACDFKCTSETCTVANTMARDQVIIGVNNKDIQRNALKEQWNLKDLVLNGRLIQAATIGTEQLTESAQINKVGKKGGKYSKQEATRKKFQQTNRNRPTPTTNCKTCCSRSCKGGNRCIAKTWECHTCSKIGHSRNSEACKGKSDTKRVKSKKEQQDGHSDEDETESESSEDERHEQKSTGRSQKCRFVAAARRTCPTNRKTKKPRYLVEVVINEKRVEMFADTGADISVMPLKKAKELGLALNKTKMKIRPYGAKPVQCVGFYIGPAMYQDSVTNIRIYVVDKNVECLLSGRASEALNIIKFIPDATIRRTTMANEFPKNSPQAKYPQVFQGVGKLKEHQVKLHVDSEVPPVAEPPRPIAFHLQKKHDQAINKMEQEGIIEEHHGPAPFISNTVPTPKEDGSLRITVDMRNANKAIKSTNLPIPRPEEIRAKLAGSKYFSKCDFTTAFHQLELEPESRYLTVFHDGQGRLMRYTRLTMGTSPASGELNKALAPLFRNIKGAHVIHDDLVLATETEKEHDKLIDEVLSIIDASGLTLNPKKCHFKKPQIPFWGMMIGQDGVSPDPAKVEALKEATAPKDKAETMSFLCMIQSYAEFIPNLSQRNAHLRELTRKNKRFIWTKNCQKEFDDLKSTLHDKATLQHFDPKKKTHLFVDAHQSGLAALLCQGESAETAKIVACASRTTTDIEKRYPQIDLEALAIDFGLRRYRQYLVGGPEVPIYTDHKPLVPIFKTSRRGSIRTQRIQLRHQDIKYQVKWQPGNINPADYLSRHAKPLTNAPAAWKKETEELEKTVWFMQLSPYTEAISMDSIIEETGKDQLLKELAASIRKGRIPKEEPFSQFYKCRDQLTVSDAGLVLKGDKIVLPAALQSKAIEKAHQGGHPGMTGLKRRIRMHFWFSGMDTMIESKVQECSGCQLFTNKTTKAQTHAQRCPDKVWEEVNIDLFGPTPNRKHVLVTQDNLSRFPTAATVQSTAAKPVIEALAKIYNDYGNPESHRTDNGPPFNSQAFKDFSDSRNIEHKKVFEYHPQGNPAETFMKPLGKALKIAKYNREPMEDAINNLLTAYRATPHPATGIPPGDYMFRHGYRSDLPRKERNEEEISDAKEKDQAQKDVRQQNTNSSPRIQQPMIELGQRVLLKNHQRKAKFDPLFEPQEYVVESLERNGVVAVSESGVRRRRHVNDVKVIPNHCKIATTMTIPNYWISSCQPNTAAPTATPPPLPPATLPHHQPAAINQRPTSNKPTRDRRPPARHAEYTNKY